MSGKFHCMIFAKANRGWSAQKTATFCCGFTCFVIAITISIPCATIDGDPESSWNNGRSEQIAGYGFVVESSVHLLAWKAPQETLLGGSLSVLCCTVFSQPSSCFH